MITAALLFKIASSCAFMLLIIIVYCLLTRVTKYPVLDTIIGGLFVLSILGIIICGFVGIWL